MYAVYDDKPLYHLWAVRLCNIFLYYLIDVTIFEKKKKVIENKMCGSISFTTFV